MTRRKKKGLNKHMINYEWLMVLVTFCGKRSLAVKQHF